MSSLEIDNISVKFGGLQALSDVSLKVPPNSFIGLMGPNGAGKTTVLNCVSRICRPDQGQIKFGGANILDLDGHEIVELGIARTFQDLNFFSAMSNMTVIDYLRLGQFNPKTISITKDAFHMKQTKVHERQTKLKARRILEFFRDMRGQLEEPEKQRGYPMIFGREGFPDLIDVEFESINNLSFAWRKRLDLARALVSDPKLLLLDEPAQGLPPSEIENLGRILKLIKSELGVGALIIEHNVETLSKISDNVIAMNLGRVIAQGLPEEVSSNKEVIEIYLGAAHEQVAEKQEGASTNITLVENKSIKSEEEKEPPLLEVRNIDLYYGLAQALFSVSIKIFPRQVVSILGTNGSGKSTLLKAVAGLEKPTFGEIHFKGHALPLGWPERLVERGIQYVPQGHVIFPELTVLENLKIGSYVIEKSGKFNFSQGLERVMHYLPNLKNYLSAQAANLSGGLQQMLTLGQAIIGQPELLLLDEPSLGLSPVLVNTLFEIIKKISVEEKCATLIVEQNVAKALQISDYVYMMSSGVVIGEGTSKSLRENDDTVQKYLGFR